MRRLVVPLTLLALVPALAGKLQGFAVRVPLPTGSLVDLTVEMQRQTTVDEVNALFASRADSGMGGRLLHGKAGVTDLLH